MISVKEMQKIELDMLENFHNICIKNNLKYYLVGGSMLGAIRHQGFIPWDDDIDVGMPRKDYEKFCRISNRNLPKHVAFLNEKDEGYYFLFGKMINNNTVLYEDSLSEYNSEIGVYLDVFPIDNIPNDRKFISKFNIAKNYFNIRVYNLPNRTKLKRILSFMTRKFPYDIQKNKLSIKNYASKYENENNIRQANLFGIYKDKEIMPREYFGKPTLYKFENLEVYGVEKPNLYLKQLYGDYMKLPPKEKQVSHHEYSVKYKDGYNIDNCLGKELQNV